MKNVSIYVHVPFCVKKCFYCAFKSAPPERGDIENWLREISTDAKKFSGESGYAEKISTIYVGGGTPTILGENEWERVGKILRTHFDLSELSEFTVEANPESLRDFHSDIWEKIGVTRVSVGVQSLDDGELQFLGRAHDSKQALAGIRSLREKFSVSADLIFGLRNQNLRNWDKNLRTLIDEGLKHISTYQLTIEEGTKFGDAPPDALSDGYPFYRYAQWLLPKKGLFQYEIASFAAHGCECRHNLRYWRQENVIGLGRHAWGYFCEDGLRYRNYDFSERLEGDERGIEAAILLLRTSDGIDKDDFAKKFGEFLLEKIISRLDDVPSSCLTDFGGKIALTKKGKCVANEIWNRL